MFSILCVNSEFLYVYYALQCVIGTPVESARTRAPIGDQGDNDKKKKKKKKKMMMMMMIRRRRGDDEEEEDDEEKEEREPEIKMSARTCAPVGDQGG